MNNHSDGYKVKSFEPGMFVLFLLIAFGWTWFWWFVPVKIQDPGIQQLIVIGGIGVVSILVIFVYRTMRREIIPIKINSPQHQSANLLGNEGKP